MAAVRPDDVMTRGLRAARTRCCATPPTTTAWSTYTCRRGRPRRDRWSSTCTAGSGAQEYDRRHARPLANALARGGVRRGGAGVPPRRRGRRLAGHRRRRRRRADAPAGLLDGLGVAPPRPTLVGHSAGGHLVLWLANQPPPRRRGSSRSRRSATCGSRRECGHGLRRRRRPPRRHPRAGPRGVRRRGPGHPDAHPARVRRRRRARRPRRRRAGAEQPRPGRAGSTGSTTASSPASTTSR